MTTVTVTRHSRTYRRSINGAWLGGATEQSAPIQVELSTLPSWTIGDGWLDVAWPDGHRESVFSSRLGFGYPPEPHGERLARLYSEAQQ